MKHLYLLLTASFLFAINPVSGQDLYVGAGIGNTFYATEWSLQDEINKLDENSTGYKFFAGITTPLFVDIEGGYRHFGTIEATELNVSFESQTTGWDVYALAKFELLYIIDVFAKAGMLFWKTENTIIAETLDETGSGFAWGVGAGVGLGPIGVRLEFENFQIEDPVTISMLTLSATYGF
jgi:hypothetical protein